MKKVYFLFFSIISVSFFLVSNYVYADINTGLITYYNFDDGSGVILTDKIDSNNGTLVNGPTWVVGKIGGALSFDGVDDYIRSDSKIGNNQSFTLACWFNARSISSTPYPVHEICGDDNVQGTPDVKGVSIRYRSNGYVYVYISDGNGSPKYLYYNLGGTLNSWHHAAVTYDYSSNLARLYVDGIFHNVLGDSITLNGYSGFEGLGNGRFSIGREYYNFYFFDGMIDDVRVYNRALSASEITDLYNYTGGSIVSPPNPPATTTPATCTSFTYSAWSSCTNSSQTRTVTSSLPLSCTGGTPITTQSCTAPLQNQDPSLVAYWDFDERSGSVINDKVGLNGNGSLVGTSWTNGKVNGALSFNGIDSYVKIATTTALAGLNSFSLSTWVKINTNKSGYQTIFERGSAYQMGGTILLYYSADFGRFIFSFYDVNTKHSWLYSPTVSTLQQWHHVVVVANNNLVKIYLDGFAGLPIEIPGLYPLQDGRGDTNIYKGSYIGAQIDRTSTPQDFLDGFVDEIKIYNRALSDSEILSLYGSSPLVYTSDFPISISNTPWPKIFGQFGGYGIVSQQDIIDMANSGFNLFYGGSYNPNSTIRQLIMSNNIKEIVNLTGRLYQVCPPNPVSGQCAISSVDEQSILNSVQLILNQTSQDPSVIGYWILDDTPGDVHTIIQKIHDLVANSNKTSIFPRPAICGLGGGLDYKSNSSQPYFSYGNVAVDSMINISPTACDAIGLYLYGSAPINDRSLIDWSMKNILPQVFAVLRSRGWDQSKQPLIALPHTFDMPVTPGWYYVMPTAADVAMQTEAYCKAGAIALLPYAWHTSISGSEHALWNSPDLVSGFKQGVQACQNKYWNISSTPVIPTPIIGDFNNDRLVNSLDFSLLVSAWNQNNASYDLNHDGIVNSLDYVIMVQNWTI